MPSEDLIIKIGELGVVGMAALALIMMAYLGILNARSRGKSEAMENTIERDRLALMGKLIDQADKNTEALNGLLADQRLNVVQNTAEHERILKVAETIADRLGALTTTTAQNVTEVQQTNRVLGNIMDTLNNPVPEPTTVQKLDQLLILLGEIKTEIVALKDEFTGRVVAVETDVKQAQAAIAELAGKVKTETQETEIADLGKTTPGTMV